MPFIITRRGKKRYRGSVMVNGKKIQKIFPDTTRETFRLAVIWEQETRNKMKVMKIDMGCWTILNWSNEYLDFSKEQYVKKVYQQKKSVLSRFIKFFGMNMFVNELTPALTLKYLREQSNTRSGYSANKDRKDLSAGWVYGVKYLTDFPRDMINPFRAVDKFKEERSPRYVPPEQDFWSIYEVTEGQDKIMLLTYLHTAGRRNEIFNLKWEDVDFGDNRIRLWTNKREQGNKEFDWLPMTTELRQVLLKWWEQRPVKDSPYVFNCLNENPYCSEYYGKPFTVRQHFMKKLCEKGGVKPFGFHAIRHLTASILYHKGYNISVIQAILRHKNPTTTNRYLRSLGLENMREALEDGLKEPGMLIPFNKKVSER